MKINKKNKSGYAVSSFIISLFSFIPLLGTIVGLLGIIFGITGLRDIKKNSLKGKKLAVWGIVLSSLGVIFTFAIYGSLFYFGFKSESGPFAGIKVDLNKQIITQNAGMLALYKKDHATYPGELKDMTEESFTIYPMDAYQQKFYYSVSEDGLSYELISSGPDKKLGTEDDVGWPFK